MREKKNWVEKSDKNSHHNSTSIKENIVEMLKRLFVQKNVRFLVSLFFCHSKEAKRNTGSNFPRPSFSPACKALLGDGVIWLLAWLPGRNYFIAVLKPLRKTSSCHLLLLRLIIMTIFIIIIIIIIIINTA